MRPWLRILVSLLLLAGIGLGTWCYFARHRMASQWVSYRVGAAGGFNEARAEIARLEGGPGRDAALRELARSWGAGNPQFDLHLARYVGSPDSSESLRKTFSLEFGWREELLPRWAHYWSWRAAQEPDREIASILAYLDLLLSAESPKPIAWREVLDVQAVFQLTGQPRLAKRLGPANWQDRYRRWLANRPDQLPHVPRPAKPFADWQGPAPKLAGVGPGGAINRPK